METMTPEQIGFSSERLARIRPAMQRYVDEGKFPGVLTLIAHCGAVVYQDSVGYMDVESARPLQEDTIFRIYSMSKPITSVGLLMLYEEGRLRLSDPVAEYIPAFANVKVYGDPPAELERPITIQHLLTHTAGLTYPSDGPSPVDVLFAKANIMRPDLTIEQFVDKLTELPLVNQPGTVWRYGVATDVLGRLIEVISGMPLDRYFQERIFGPLGMVDTGFVVPPEKLDRLATEYHWNEAESKLEVSDRPPQSEYAVNSAFLSGGGGLVSTLADYLRFATMLLNMGEVDDVRLLGRKTVAMMSSNHLPPEVLARSVDALPQGFGFGLGVGIARDMIRFAELGSCGMYEWGGLANTLFWVDPQEQIIGLLMTQHVPGFHFPLTTDFRTLVYQALLD